MGPYAQFGQCGSGSGDRSPVPAALAAVGTGGRCSEVRHLRPRTGPSGLFLKRCARWHASSRCRPTRPENPAARRDGHSQ
ncbi:hypothetical protein AV521_14380 [Streptomyces sp. IMTB 2501]|nr:hypothetical protein AV521_14380 [Streptomyces sp. IMTB 2501]